MFVLKPVAALLPVLLAAGAQAHAAGNTLFDEVLPLTVPSVPVPVGSPLEKTHAFVLSGGPGVVLTQQSVASRDTLGSLGNINVGRDWDMIDTNRTGPDAGRYLFMPFEPSNQAGPNTGSGALRFDKLTGTATTIVPVGTQNWQRGDASRWTPWGGWLSGEENFSATTAGTGRLFEVTNPLTATATTLSDGNGNLVQRNSVLPLVSHEGLAFDRQNNLYFIDENSSGSFYKFTSANPNAGSGDEFFAAGTVSALKVGAGNNSSVAGSFVWADLDITGPNADGRALADAVGATAFNRPEDMEITRLANGDEAIVFAATGTHDVWIVNLASGAVDQFVTRNTVNLATGETVGSAFTSPDNIAIDADGNFYIVEDQGTPNADIWRVVDANKDGVAEGVVRWAGLQVQGAEPTGLFFDPFDPNTAWVNVQHPDSDNDQLIRITAAVPEPETWAMLLAGLGLVGAAARRRK